MVVGYIMVIVISNFYTMVVLIWFSWKKSTILHRHWWIPPAAPPSERGASKTCFYCPLPATLGRKGLNRLLIWCEISFIVLVPFLIRGTQRGRESWVIKLQTKRRKRERGPIFKRPRREFITQKEALISSPFECLTSNLLALATERRTVQITQGNHQSRHNKYKKIIQNAG